MWAISYSIRMSGYGDLRNEAIMLGMRKNKQHLIPYAGFDASLCDAHDWYVFIVSYFIVLVIFIR